MINPLPEYETRRAAWAVKVSLLQRSLDRLGNARLALAAATVVLVALTYGPTALSGWWIAPPLLALFALFVQHSRLAGQRAFAQRGVRYYDRALDRLHDRWQGKGETGDRFRTADHVYADDLDIFGKGGLFELLCTARTAPGEETLAHWLLHPANQEEASARQEAVRELSARLDLREDIALLGEDIRAQVQASVLQNWGCRAPVPFPAALRPVAMILSATALALSLSFLLQRLPLWPLALVVAINVLIVRLTKPIVSEIVSSVAMPAGHLAILGLLIERLEQETFQSPLLRQWIAQLKVSGQPAAQQIKHLERLFDWLGADPHPLIKVIQVALLWPLQVAFGIEMWRRECGSHIGDWISALAGFEAISALASLAYERPAWHFPTLLPPGQASFAAKGLRHPLVSTTRCVANDVTLGEFPRLLIVSGSNMSGKSTLLRTIGLNTVLAWAGAPVCAEQLALSPLETAASIRVSDSLQDNRSRFMAEITRLRQIVDLTRESTPVLFLLDELLSGTNSHDRRIGAGGLIKGLLRGNAIGLVTTHDLALAEIATEPGSSAANVHFEDKVVDGKMEFDYQLRAGVVTHSNALELMRAVGLDV